MVAVWDLQPEGAASPCIRRSPEDEFSSAIVQSRDGRGNIVGLNARTGALLWHYSTGATMAASPMSYAVDGKQYVTIQAGGVLYSFGCRSRSQSAGRPREEAPDQGTLCQCRG